MVLPQVKSKLNTFWKYTVVSFILNIYYFLLIPSKTFFLSQQKQKIKLWRYYKPGTWDRVHLIQTNINNSFPKSKALITLKCMLKHDTLNISSKIILNQKDNNNISLLFIVSGKLKRTHQFWVSGWPLMMKDVGSWELEERISRLV